jgi:hypothetical protein
MARLMYNKYYNQWRIVTVIVLVRSKLDDPLRIIYFSDLSASSTVPLATRPFPTRARR